MKFGLLASLAASATAAMAMDMPRFLPLAPRRYYPSKNPTNALKIRRAAQKRRNRKAAK